MNWHKAIQKILEQSDNAMNYTDIAEEVVKQGLRNSVGATPASTVNAYINRSINEDADKSPYTREGRGLYFLRRKLTIQPETKESSFATSTVDEDDSIIQALGMYWQRDRVLWSAKPKLLGMETNGALPVNFCDQIGIYLLHDGREVLYVGQTAKQTLGKRLDDHTHDRMQGRWDRFSWFGLKGVSDNGALKESSKTPPAIGTIIDTLEAILIEGLEPRQNRKRGNSFNAVDYLQAEDPEIDSQRKKRLLSEMQSKL